MNCLTARQTLELARPGAPDAPLVDEAARHIDECPTCRVAVLRQTQFDKKVGGLIRDVPVPIGLKERLCAGLEEDVRIQVGEATNGVAAVRSAKTSDLAPVVSFAATSTRASGPSIGTRRRWLGVISLAAAACVVAGIGAWSLWPRPQWIELDGVINRLATNDISPANLAEFTQFSGGVAPKVPGTMVTPRLVLPARRLGNIEVAVYFFTLSGPRRTILQGRLAVIPKRLVKPNEVPSAASFLAGPPTYKPGFCATVWSEGEFVYICCLSGGEDGLHLLGPQRPVTM